MTTPRLMAPTPPPLTTDECTRAKCDIFVDPIPLIEHTGSRSLVRRAGGMWAECQGCGTIFSPAQVRAILAAAHGKAP